MASSTHLQEFITCTVCFEIYNLPQSLQCRHVYCHDCIQQLKQGSEIMCPGCKETCSMQDVKKDFRTQTLVDEYKLHITTPTTLLERSDSPMRICDVCREPTKVVTSFCEFCEELLCKDCNKVHRGMKVSKDHKFADFVQVLDEKQRDIELEIKKLQVKRKDVQINVSSVDCFTRQLHKSKEQLIGEVNKCRKDIKERVDEHHDGLINEIKSTIESLHESLKEVKTLFLEYDSKLDDKVSFLAGVSKDPDFVRMTETLTNLSQQIEKDLQEIDRDIPKFDLCTKCPVSVLKGDGVWCPQKSTQIKVAQETMENIRKLTCYSKGHQREKQIHQSYRKVKAVYIDFFPLDLCVCNNELWLCGFDKGLILYNFNLEQTKRIQHHQMPKATSVLRTTIGMIVCDCETGVHHLNHQGDYINQISSGSFCDACLIGTSKIYALDYQTCEIYTFVKHHNGWVKGTRFKLVHYTEGDPGHKLCATPTHLYVSSHDNCILVYNVSGEYESKTAGSGDEIGKFKNNYLSDVDSAGRLLVCDCSNDRLQVLDAQTKQWSELSGLKAVGYPMSAGVSDKHLWIGTSHWSNDRQLFKYEAI